MNWLASDQQNKTRSDKTSEKESSQNETTSLFDYNLVNQTTNSERYQQ